MPFSVNKHILVGYVGWKPETKITNGSNTLVATFTLATSDRYTSKSGNMVENTDWHNVVAFSRQAEIVRDYVKKGSKLYIEGKVCTRSWEDKETHKKVYRTETIVQRIGLLDGKQAGESSADPDGSGQQANGENLDAEPPEDSILIETSEVPF
jgi:single-strand DNA-binding protein